MSPALTAGALLVMALVGCGDEASGVVTRLDVTPGHPDGMVSRVHRSRVLDAHSLRCLGGDVEYAINAEHCLQFYAEPLPFTRIARDDTAESVSGRTP